MKRRAVSCSWALVLSLAASVHIANAASFDCAKAGSTVEKLICNVKQLSGLDDQLSLLYKAALSLASNKDAFKTNQRSWLKEQRNPCKDEVCLLRVYEERIATFESIERLRKRAEQGDAIAQFNMGLLYDADLGNPEKAEVLEWDQQAAKQGYKTGQWFLGKTYATGADEDFAEAVKWYRKAAEQGYAVAQFYLGRTYKGDDQEQTTAETRKWCYKAAEQGYVPAQLYLGDVLVFSDAAEAMKWYRKAADQGSAKGQFSLGWRYFKGTEVPQDYAEAVKWVRKAADQGYESAQRLLGEMYARGTGVPQDYAEAVKWYRKAADQNHVDAQLYLGEMYSKGIGVPKDPAEALKWYRQAAQLGNAAAQVYLGDIYARGIGVPQDYAEAVKWYREAADRGNADGQYKLGEMYSKGTGVPQDSSAAKEWYGKADEQGYTPDATSQPIPPTADPPAPTAEQPVSTAVPPAATADPAQSSGTPEPSLKVKGLFIGMDIKTVPAILKQKFPEGQAFEIADAIAERRSVLVFHGTDGVVCIVACGPDSPAVLAIAFEKVAVDALFNAAGMEASEFAKTFVDAYQIPGMAPSDDLESWFYLSPEGYRVNITTGKQLIIVKTPSSTERKKSFD